LISQNSYCFISARHVERAICCRHASVRLSHWWIRWCGRCRCCYMSAALCGWYSMTYRRSLRQTSQIVGQSNDFMTKLCPPSRANFGHMLSLRVHKIIK